MEIDSATTHKFPHFNILLFYPKATPQELKLEQTNLLLNQSVFLNKFQLTLLFYLNLLDNFLSYNK